METRIENGKLICTNVITKEELQRIQNKMLSDHFPWYYTEHVVEDKQKMTEDKDQLQFVHNFHGVSDVSTEWSNWEMLYPIFNVLKANTFVRVKANNIPRTEKIIKHGFHADTRVVLSYTAIYYVNSTDGYTEFRDGTKVPSVENSMVVFPSYMEHTGTTCTDKRSRININMNYMPNHHDELTKRIRPEGADKIIKLWENVW